MDHKMSVFRARRILGKAAEGLPDEDVELLIDHCYAMAEMMFEHFKFNDKLKKPAPKYEKP